MAKATDGQNAPSLDVGSKRKKGEDVVENGVKKKQRSRVSYSCGECHRRKQKCDRQAPCSHCVARKVPELCKPYTPGRSDQDIHARLARLEHIIEVALPQFANQGFASSRLSEARASGSRPESFSDDEHGSQNEEADAIAAGTFQGGEWYGGSVYASVAPAAVVEELAQSSGYNSRSGARLDTRAQHMQDAVRSHPASTESGIANLLVSVKDMEPDPMDNLDSLVKDCGVSPNRIPELIKELPPFALCDILLDHYFENVNWTRYPIHEADFRAQYQAVKDGGLAPTPAVIRFLPLLFVVLAIAVRLAPEDISGDAGTRRISSLRFYWSSRRSLLISAAVHYDSIEMVLVRLLSARFLTFDRRITECWSQLGAAVRTAQALGLHRDGGIVDMDPFRAEYRRRIWAYLYIADRSYALVLGRPTAIHDDHISTLPPMNITDLTPFTTDNYPTQPGPPLTQPTRMTIVILRQALAVIIGKVVNHFQQVRIQSHYSEVLALDDELQRFMDTLPPHYSLHPDMSLDTTETYIPMHRFLLITEVLFVRISLHRPYLLRRLDTDRYAASRRICFALAMLDFEVRQKFRASRPTEVISNAYREFQTAMVSGIYLVLDPNGKDAAAMHAILDSFLTSHKEAKELDQTTRRELKIIEFLKGKASLVETHNSNNGIPSSPNHSDQSRDVQANLLLSLQHSRPTAPSNPQAGPSHLASKINGIVHSPSMPQHSAPNMRPYIHMGISNPNASLTPPSMGALATSPTMQRVAAGETLTSAHIASSTASPATEDDRNAAQSLLDHWYNTVSNGAAVDGFAVGGAAFSQGHWGTLAGNSSFPEFGPDSLWMNGNQNFFTNTDPNAIINMEGVEGSDWSIWENLVSQIRGVPIP